MAGGYSLASGIYVVFVSTGGLSNIGAQNAAGVDARPQPPAIFY